VCEYLHPLRNFSSYINFFLTPTFLNFIYSSARLIKNTVGESLSFVKDFSKPSQWKRDSNDKFDPYTPSVRYEKQASTRDAGSAPSPYVPTPLSYTMDRSKLLTITADWSISVPSEWTQVAQFLKGECWMDNGGEAGMVLKERLSWPQCYFHMHICVSGGWSDQSGFQTSNL
jgi:hypothetical protein